MERNRVLRSLGSDSGQSSGGGSVGEIGQVERFEAAASTSADTEEKIFVAVGKDYKESKSTLIWALRNSPMSKKFTLVLVHVHRPAEKIPVLGGKFPARQLTKQQVNAYRLLEREKMNETLEKYLLLCAAAKVQAETLVIDTDDVAKGILTLIAQHGITKLVMGAASDGRYSKKMKSPRSETACTVQRQALPSCGIWFVCKGNLICTRGTDLHDGKLLSPLASPSCRSVQSEPLGKSLSQGNQSSVVGEAFRHRSRSDNYDLHRREITMGLPREGPMRSIPHNFSTAQETNINVWEGIPRKISQSSDASSSTGRASLHESGKDFPSSSPQGEQEGGIMQDDVYNWLKQAFEEAYEESCGHQKAVKDALEVEAVHKAKMVENLYARELKQRASIEEKLSAARLLISSLQTERDKLRWGLHNVIREAEGLQQERVVNGGACRMQNFSEFPYSELEQATNNFDNLLKIGEGGYGSVYKGLLRHTAVAIKKLHPQGMQGQIEFHQEVKVLSRVRHPNLVTLIGACVEAWCLVYEFLSNGSLEDRLLCKGNSPPLSWLARICIAAEICSALIFLHSNKPHGVVHGDLKPANILLDGNCVSKLSDFGISRFLIQSNATTTACHLTTPKGTFPYMDPEFFATGELSPASDIYSFGVIILRLLTGRPALGIAKFVQEAVDRGILHVILDKSAGDWSFWQAKQLAHLGLSCCEVNRRNRPDLVNDIWRVLEPMKKAASTS